jgi:hypothetical protein
VGAGLAFKAAQERYSRQDFITLNYHVHIPAPDPMVNPSTLKRQAFYGVRSSPSYFFDGDSDGGAWRFPHRRGSVSGPRPPGPR